MTTFTQETIQTLHHLTTQDPIQLGYSFRRWTAKRLADHLAHHHRIIVSSHQIKQILSHPAPIFGRLL